jgi:hypothetical protein
MSKEFVLLEQIAKQIIKTCSSFHFLKLQLIEKKSINPSINQPINHLLLLLLLLLFKSIYLFKYLFDALIMTS